MIRIACDSTCDLSQELIERFNISILPLHVVLDEEEHLDGVDIDQAGIFAWADANKKTPKTSAPSIERTMNFFQQFLDAGDELIVFSISAPMSTCNNVMHLAVNELEAEDRISVIDSANLSTGIGLLLLEASEMASSNMKREDIVAKIEELIPRVRASFVIDTLQYLYRGGRCSGMAALVGGALKLHPEIVVKDGAMVVSKKYRGKMNVVYKKYAEDLLDAMKNAETKRVFITHTCLTEEGPEEIRAYLESLNIFDEILETHAGGVVSSHCGPGTLGVLFISK